VNALLVDTNIISYANNEHSLWRVYQPLLEGSQLFVAAQTIAELQFGAFKKGWGEKRLRRLEVVLSPYIIIHTNESICTEWAKIRHEAESLGRSMGTADIWIAATARAYGLALVTHNSQDFDFLQRLRLISK
jgi:tRNA(fMet)-specific endonuclease VapC